MMRENEDDAFELEDESDSFLCERWLTKQDGSDTFSVDALVRLSVEKNNNNCYVLYAFLDMGSSASQDLISLGVFKTRKDAMTEKRRIIDWMHSEMINSFEELHVMPDVVSLDDF